MYLVFNVYVVYDIAPTEHNIFINVKSIKIEPLYPLGINYHTYLSLTNYMS
jgi:hypothetical protein